MQEIKISIDRNPELMGKGYLRYTWTDGKRVTLYPDAMCRMFENAAYGSEKDWWKYYQLMNGGN